MDLLFIFLGALPLLGLPVIGYFFNLDKPELDDDERQSRVAARRVFARVVAAELLIGGFVWFYLLADYRHAWDAESEFKMAREAGGPGQDLCVAATRAKEAWLQAERREKYEQWSLTAQVECYLRY